MRRTSSGVSGFRVTDGLTAPRARAHRVRPSDQKAHFLRIGSCRFIPQAPIQRPAAHRYDLHRIVDEQAGHCGIHEYHERRAPRHRGEAG